MPKSKRAKVVSLTKVAKKSKEQKTNLVDQIQENADKWQYCWLFQVGSMRNAHLKTIRNQWKGSARIFFGKGSVMAKALGKTPEEERQLGLAKLAAKIKAQVGLFFTDTKPEEVIEWFNDFQRPDFARTGNTATRTVILPAGPVMRYFSNPPEPFPHNEEPQLRKLGLSTSMSKGVPTLTVSHEVCKEGQTLTSEQAQLLKLTGVMMVVFRVDLLTRWEAATGNVIDVARIT